MDLGRGQAHGVIIRAMRCPLGSFRNVPAWQPVLQVRLGIHRTRRLSPAVFPAQRGRPGLSLWADHEIMEACGGKGAQFLWTRPDSQCCKYVANKPQAKTHWAVDSSSRQLKR